MQVVYPELRLNQFSNNNIWDGDCHLNSSIASS